MGWMTGVVMMAAMTVAAQAQTAPAVKPVMTNKPWQEDTQAMLLERGKTLLAKAAKSADGSASEMLNQYAGYYTLLVARTRSGIVEVHANYDDLFFVLDGELTEVAGGTMPADAKEISPGEMRAAKMNGGTPNLLRKGGDIIHIAANTPHITTIPAGKTVVYYVIKVGVRK
jgi:hypothetical protein